MSWLRKNGLALLSAGLISLSCILAFNCKKAEPPKEIKPVETAAAPETDLQLSRLAGDLLSIQEQIRERPAEKTPRTQLLALAVNPAAGMIRAVGIGKVSETSQNRALDLQNIERAAFIDACRWLVYIRAWQKDVTTPDFGKIQGNLPAARTIYKHANPGQVVVMVETNLH